MERRKYCNSTRRIIIGFCLIWVFSLPVCAQTSYKVSGNIEKNKNVTRLYINDCDDWKKILKYLPSYKNLEELALLNCPEMSVIPNEVFELSELKSLDVFSGSLSAIPDSIRKLRNLRSFTCFNCAKLSYISPELAKIYGLEALYLGHMLFGDIIDLRGYPTLRYLYISGTKLKALPVGIDSSRTIEMIHLGQNSYIDEEKEFERLSKMNSIREIRISDSNMTALPIAVTQMKLLEKIQLINCPMTTLPPEMINMESLQELNIRLVPVEFKGDLTKNARRVLPPNCKIID